MRAFEVGEWGVINLIWSRLKRDPLEVLGLDDVVARRIGGGKLLVAHVDTLSQSTDVLPGMTPHSIGFKSVVMNVSDMAAKGVEPLGMLFSLGLPSDYPLTSVAEIAEGWRDATSKYGIYVWGGDITESRELMVTGAIIGLAPEGRVVGRRGARPGDLIACMGSFGLTSVAYMILLEGKKTRFKAVEERAKRAVYYPKAYLKEGIRLARLRVLTASMDSSDGLAWSLHTISSLNNVGIELTNIPVPREVLAYADEHGLDPYELALYGGEEYSLVFTMRPDGLDLLPNSLRRRVTVMGKLTRDKKIRLIVEGSERIIEPRGWEHFKR